MDPGETGDLTNEATFTGYARVAVPRSGAGWAEANGSASNFADVNIPECTGLSDTVTHFAICKSLAGDDMILKGQLPAPALVSDTVQLQFSPGQLVVNLD